MIRNINPISGDSAEFYGTAEMEAAIKMCGYKVPEDGLKEGRDYETVWPVIIVTTDDGAEQVFSVSDLGMRPGTYTRKEWLDALEKAGYTQLTEDMIS